LAICVLVIAAFGAPNAKADIYTDYQAIYCAGAACEESPPPTQTLLPSNIIYDDTTGSFTVFQVLFGGTNYDLTTSANDPVLVNGGIPFYGCTQPGTGGVATLNLLVDCLGEGYGAADVTLSGGVLTFEGGDTNPADSDYGTICVSSAPGCSVDYADVSGSVFLVATPEPGTVGLMLTVIGLALVMRKCAARGLPQRT
jgi:hypothetical protein